MLDYLLRLFIKAMALKIKKYEKMIRGNPVDDGDANKKETLNVIRLNELEYLKQCIIVNSLRHIEDDALNDKCTRIATHYRLFKDDESLYPIAEMTNTEKDKFKKCIGKCIQKESAGIIEEKECIPAGMSSIVNTKY